MKIIEARYDGSTSRFTCEYACAGCGRKQYFVGGAPQYCPGCGRKLNTRGKPDELRPFWEMIVPIVFMAIDSGILERAPQNFTQMSCDHSTTCRRSE